MKTTHILMKFPSDQREDLFRASDGMMIASRKGCTVMFGENPATPEHRLFIDANKAYQWLKFLAQKDLDESVGDSPQFIEERDGESLIVKPNTNNISLVRN